jgi:F-type H+-transporting ATPase subunit delta
MSVARIAHRYAKSLLQLALEKNQLAEVTRDVQLMKAATDGSRDFKLMLKSPIIHADKKMAIINAVFDNQVGVIMRSFLEILVRKGREGWLPEALNSYVEMYNKHEGITPVVLTTAYPVSDEIRDMLMNKLRNQASLEDIQVETRVDESLIGGYILRYEDKMIDTSIARGLTILKDDFDNNDYIRKF